MSHQVAIAIPIATRVNILMNMFKCQMKKCPMKNCPMEKNLKTKLPPTSYPVTFAAAQMSVLDTLSTADDTSGGQMIPMACPKRKMNSIAAGMSRAATACSWK